MNDEAALLPAGTWFQPGPATLFRHGPAWLVLVPGVNRDLLQAGWDLVLDPPEPSAVLETLARNAGKESVEKLPPILYGTLAGTSATVLIKGSTPVVVHTASGHEQVAGSEEEPVVSKEFTDVYRIAFGTLPSEDEQGGLRVIDGMVRVRGFVLGTEALDSLDEDARQVLLEQIEEQGRSSISVMMQ